MQTHQGVCGEVYAATVSLKALGSRGIFEAGFCQFAWRLERCPANMAGRFFFKTCYGTLNSPMAKGLHMFKHCLNHLAVCFSPGGILWDRTLARLFLVFMFASFRAVGAVPDAQQAGCWSGVCLPFDTLGCPDLTIFCKMLQACPFGQRIDEP